MIDAHPKKTDIAAYDYFCVALIVLRSQQKYLA